MILGLIENANYVYTYHCLFRQFDYNKLEMPTKTLSMCLENALKKIRDAERERRVINNAYNSVHNYLIIC